MLKDVSLFRESIAILTQELGYRNLFFYVSMCLNFKKEKVQSLCFEPFFATIIYIKQFIKLPTQIKFEQLIFIFEIH